MLPKLRLQKRRRHVSRYNRYNPFHWLIIICLENLPKGRLDQVVMFMFLCALFPFLHAFLGIGGETCPVEDTTGGPPHMLLGKNTGGPCIDLDQLLLIHPPDPSVPQDVFPDLTLLVPYHPEMAFALPSAAAFEQTVGPGALSGSRNTTRRNTCRTTHSISTSATSVPKLNMARQSQRRIARRLGGRGVHGQ